MTEVWIPFLSLAGRTLHERLVEAIRADILSGRLPQGFRMPTHRGLAEMLGVGIGTATKAYAEAERLGLLTSHVGRGTFVAAAPSSSTAASGKIDLSMNLPPAGPAAARLSDTLAKLRRRSDLSDCLTLAPPPGTPADRQATADWLRGHARLPDADWRRLLLCNGAQQAMALTLDALCRPGDTIMVEAASFFGIRAIAEYRRLGLAGLAMDRHGVLPEALDRTAAETGSRLVYLQPTLQNPTGRTMPQSRRAEIAAVARSRDLWILEDDVYGPLAWQAQPHGDETPLACLAPERCFYAGSLSKALTPGLRAGFLMAPSADHFETLSGAMRAVCYSVSALTPLIASQWIKDGTAAEILKENAAETTARTRLALVILAEAAEAPSFPTSLHIWLPMTELDAERVVSRTLRQDVVLTPPSSFSFDARKLSGLRICVSAIPDRAGLEQGLRIVAAAMRSDREAPMQSLV